MSRPPHPLLLVLAVIAALEGLVLLGYAGFDIVEGLRVGVQGPSAVSNVPGLLLQIVIFLVLGAAGIAIAVGWWRGRRGARAPFVVAQLLALVVGVPLLQSGGSQSSIGLVIVVVAGVGIVLAMLPSVTRAVLADE